MIVRRRYLITGGLLLAAVLLTLAWLNLAPWPRTGATFVAKQLCSCLFLTGRTEASCRTDFGGYVNRYTVRIDRGGLPKSARVTATLALFRGEAVYEDGYGCRIAQ